MGRLRHLFMTFNGLCMIFNLYNHETIILIEVIPSAVEERADFSAIDYACFCGSFRKGFIFFLVLPIVCVSFIKARHEPAI